MKTFINFAATAVLGLIVTNTVHAAEETKSLTVQFADLDLSRDEGAATLFNRIKGAARRVCSSLQGTSLQQKDEYATCVDLALSTTVARVDRPALTEYLASRSSTPQKVSIRIASGH